MTVEEESFKPELRRGQLPKLSIEAQWATYEEYGYGWGAVVMPFVDTPEALQSASLITSSLLESLPEFNPPPNPSSGEEIGDFMYQAFNHVMAGRITEDQYIQLADSHRRKRMGDNYTPFKIPNEFRKYGRIRSSTEKSLKYRIGSLRIRIESERRRLVNRIFPGSYGYLGLFPDDDSKKE